MKKTLSTVVILLVFALTACSKERAVNRKLDGNWRAILHDGELVGKGESYLYLFTKDRKDNGVGTITYKSGGADCTSTFTYTLSGKVMTMLIADPQVSSLRMEVVHVDIYEKDQIIFTDQTNGGKTILEPW